jgi:hypothetical protein
MDTGGALLSLLLISRLANVLVSDLTWGWIIGSLSESAVEEIGISGE